MSALASVPPHDPIVSVLVVDDTPSNLLAVSAVLRPLGVRVVEAHSGPEALEHVARESFAVALLDVQMPGMDGFEVAKRLRGLENGREMPVIFVTAIHREDGYSKRGYDVGAADYITKPFDTDVLRARVRAFVSLYAQRENLRKRQVAERTFERDHALKRLRALERIGTLAVESSDVKSFLRELIDVFLEAADSADSGCVLLRDGDTLRVQASFNAEGLHDDEPISIGDGFVGTIAATGRPLHVSDAATLRSLVGSAPLHPETKGLFGVPLVGDDGVLGVAYVSSTKASEFAESERRLFVALADRAAWAVSQRRNRERVAAVLNAAPSCIVVLRGPDLVCELANPAARALYRGQEILGRTVRHLGAGPAQIEELSQVLATGKSVTRDEVVLRTNWDGDGAVTDKSFRYTAHPARDLAGGVDGVILFAVETTAEVRARKLLQERERERTELLESERSARAEAEVANHAKDAFLATVSHELRTPLNAILGWTVMARRTAPPELDRALAIIERNARTQARIIEDVLDMSRIISGKLSLELSRVSVPDAIAGAIEVVRPVAEAKGVGLVADVDPAIGIVSADADRFQQIVWNLLTNAVKFTPRGGRVVTGVTLEDGRLVIRVVDTGEGIREEFLPHLFEPFRQADDTTTRRHGGIGLGLAIVRQLVQAHDGTITAESDGEGRGSTFTVSLPARRVADLEAGRRFGEDTTMSSSVRLDKLRVLVVDDDEDARSLLEHVLVARGATVASASCAAQALAELDAFHPDVLVSDIGMPDVDGYSFIRTVRGLPPDKGGRVPAVALTAYTRTSDSDLAVAAGFQMHVPKPVEPGRLVTVVANLGGIATSR
ncbi:MAG: response regulator [Polyangiaceae bacterium]